MGNKTPSVDLPIFFDIYNHPRLGQIYRLQASENSQQQISFSVLVQNYRNFVQWNKNVKQLKNTVCSELLFLPVSFQFNKDGLCKNGGKVSMIFKDYMFSLKEEIINRIKINRHFKQTEIWFLLYSILRVESYLQKLGSRIGEIRPSNILINQDGQINILSQFSWPGHRQALNSRLQQLDQQPFLAPEQLKQSNSRISRNLSSGIKSNVINKAQVFSIGITILEMTSLIESKQLYDKKNFREEKLEQHLEVVRKKYSEKLVKILQVMLKIAPENRATATSILNILTTQKQNILTLKQFNITVNQEELIKNSNGIIAIHKNVIKVPINFIHKSKTSKSLRKSTKKHNSTISTREPQSLILINQLRTSSFHLQKQHKIPQNPENKIKSLTLSDLTHRKPKGHKLTKSQISSQRRRHMSINQA